MTDETPFAEEKLTNADAALEAVKRGFQPIPIEAGQKRPTVDAWQKIRWENSEDGLAKVGEAFEKWSDQGQDNLGVLLGEPSSGLIDIDLDDPLAARLAPRFLPHTAAVSGREGNPRSHRWYRAEPGTLQPTKQLRGVATQNSPKGEMLIEYRSTGAQTIIPPSTHPCGEEYRWEGQPWGGDSGPAVVNGEMLQARVHLLAMAVLLAKAWPSSGSRHDAYLALAGGLLRDGDGVSDFWEVNAPELIKAVAAGSGDEEVGQRVGEVVPSTARRLGEGKTVYGWPTLEDLLGEDGDRVVTRAQNWKRDIEKLRGVETAAPRGGRGRSLSAPPSNVRGRERVTATGDATDAADWDMSNERLERDALVEADRIRVRERARQIIAEEKAGALTFPKLESLSDFLAEPDIPVPFLIDKLLPMDSRAVVSAKGKAGKTTLMGNVIRSVADGQPFLDRFSVAPVKRVLLLDNELSRDMLKRWLRAHGVKNPDKVELIQLRGNLSAFNILDPATRTRWAEHLGSADLVIFDCLRPAMDALGLDENHDAGRFLEAFDELTTEAGITSTLIVHHMGHAGERSRGDSRIIDWPDANWKLTTEGKDTDESEGEAARYFSANGRDVDLPKTLLAFDPFTRGLTALEGTKKEIKAREAVRQVLRELADSEGLTKSEIEKQFAGGSTLSRELIRDAIKAAKEARFLTVTKEKSNRHVHRITPAGRQFASSPQFADRAPRAGFR